MNGARPIYPHAPGERFARLDYAVTPLVVIWELTRACSLVCTHCRADAIPKRHPLELDTAEGFDLMDQVKELGAPVFVLTGGDPLMRRDFYDLVEYGTKIGLRVRPAYFWSSGTCLWPRPRPYSSKSGAWRPSWAAIMALPPPE